jgi:hypothetical protein
MTGKKSILILLGIGALVILIGLNIFVFLQFSNDIIPVDGINNNLANTAVASSTTESKSGTCVEKNGSCCLDDVCAAVDVMCVIGNVPQFNGCDENCRPIVDCVPGN